MPTKQPNSTQKLLVAALEGKQNILVATHIFPDADALGSQLALGNILESLGRRVVYYNEETYPEHFAFLPGCEKLTTVLPDLHQIDAAIAVDCGDAFRLGKAREQFLEIHPFLVIDHHAGHKAFGDHSWVEPKRSSCGEMVYDLAVALGATVSYEAAYCLFTAIVADSGSFKYDSTSAYTFQVASALVDLGVNPSEVAAKLFDNFTPQRLHLLEQVLGTLELHAEDRLAIITATDAMFNRTGTSRNDTEDFINFPRSMGSVQVAVFIKDAKGGMISVSLRAKGHCDVSRIAAKFGGGGHRNAAGFRLADKTLAMVRQELLEVVNAELAGCAAGDNRDRN